MLSMKYWDAALTQLSGHCFLSLKSTGRAVFSWYGILLQTRKKAKTLYLSTQRWTWNHSWGQKVSDFVGAAKSHWEKKESFEQKTDIKWEPWAPNIMNTFLSVTWVWSSQTACWGGRFAWLVQKELNWWNFFRRPVWSELIQVASSS